MCVIIVLENYRTYLTEVRFMLLFQFLSLVFAAIAIRGIIWHIRQCPARRRLLFIILLILLTLALLYVELGLGWAAEALMAKRMNILMDERSPFVMSLLAGCMFGFPGLLAYSDGGDARGFGLMALPVIILAAERCWVLAGILGSRPLMPMSVGLLKFEGVVLCIIGIAGVAALVKCRRPDALTGYGFYPRDTTID